MNQRWILIFNQKLVKGDTKSFYKTGNPIDPVGGLQINELTRYYGLYRVPKSRTIFELQEGCERKNDAG